MLTSSVFEVVLARLSAVGAGFVSIPFNARLTEHLPTVFMLEWHFRQVIADHTPQPVWRLLSVLVLL